MLRSTIRRVASSSALMVRWVPGSPSFGLNPFHGILEKVKLSCLAYGRYRSVLVTQTPPTIPRFVRKESRSVFNRQEYGITGNLSPSTYLYGFYPLHGNPLLTIFVMDDKGFVVAVYRCSKRVEYYVHICDLCCLFWKCSLLPRVTALGTGYRRNHQTEDVALSVRLRGYPRKHRSIHRPEPCGSERVPKRNATRWGTRPDIASPWTWGLLP